MEQDLACSIFHLTYRTTISISEIYQYQILTNKLTIMPVEKWYFTIVIA